MHPGKFIFVTLIVLFLFVQPSYAQGEESELVQKDGEYKIEVRARQFAFDLIDLNQVDQLIQEGMDNDTARANAALSNRIINLEKGAPIIFVAYSVDVLHGLTIPKLDLSVELLAPVNGTYQIQVIEETLPDISTNVGAYCSVYCGPNHENMQFIMVIGTGESEGFNLFGLDIYDWIFILIIILVSGAIVIIGLVKPFWIEDEL